MFVGPAAVADRLGPGLRVAPLCLGDRVCRLREVDGRLGLPALVAHGSHGDRARLRLRIGADDAATRWSPDVQTATRVAGRQGGCVLAGRIRPVWARKPWMSSGRYWICLSR